VTVRALKVAIVDDEPLAREALRIRLGWMAGVDVVAEAATGAAAIEQLTEALLATLDVIFLDIQMPDADGFAVLRALERGMLPAIVFVTAHDRYALNAFRVGAFDYLLKPFDDDALRATVERARLFVSLVRGDAGQRLRVRAQDRTVFLDLDDIDWVEALGDYVRVHTGSDSYTMRGTMRAVEAQLDAPKFLRVHRGAIVAARMIRELQPYSRGEHLVVLKNGVKLPLSRRYRARVESALVGIR
jgi:two-component system, LytTR family, response regulator